MTELDDKIKALEDQWNKYHKDPFNNPMPDMIQLTKLRIEKKTLLNNGTSDKQ